jgi:hypothetical protein
MKYEVLRIWQDKVNIHIFNFFKPLSAGVVGGSWDACRRWRHRVGFLAWNSETKIHHTHTPASAVDALPLHPFTRSHQTSGFARTPRFLRRFLIFGECFPDPDNSNFGLGPPLWPLCLKNKRVE